MRRETSPSTVTGTVIKLRVPDGLVSSSPPPAGRGMTPIGPMALGKEKKLLAMTSEISKRMAKAKAVE